MVKCVPALIALAVMFGSLSVATARPSADESVAATKHIVKKSKAARHRSKYGFLPGYRPPEVIARERARKRYENGPHWYGPAFPGFYRGRWNGGGFGPCYELTPIGYMWTCGR